MFYRRLHRVLPVVSALRRRRFAFLFAVAISEVRESDRGGFVECAPIKQLKMRKQRDEDAAAAYNIDISDGLLLYYDQFSYYSQKVVMALHEKNLPFDKKVINIIKNEQYQPWFLFLNPRGEVPVLQDTGKIIPDSARIIDYLEDNFSNGDTPRLIPMDQGPEIRQKVTHFRSLIQKAPGNLLMEGALLNQELLRNPKTPFIGPVRRALANAEKNSGKNLREYAKKNPEARDLLLHKADVHDKNYEKMSVLSNFKALLDDIHHILDKVEAELSTHKEKKEDWWLCSDRFTIADIELTVLLVRINQLGLEHVFWADGRRPYLETYFERVKLRDSFKKTIPGTLVLLKMILMSQAPILAGVVAVLALVIGGVFIAKRYI